MQTVVTGGCGFLGSALVRALLERGEQVRVVDLPQADRSALDGLQVEWIGADVRDREKVTEALRGARWVFHTAAQVGFSRRRNRRQWRVNVEGSRTVMQACLENNVERVVHTSSVSALGFPENASQPADEDAPYNWGPFHIGYMDSKRAGEMAVLKLAHGQGLPAVVVNPGTIFGPGSAAGINASGYLVNIARGRLWAYPGGGTNCVGLDDVVRGELLAAEKGRVGERYILGGENLTYRELFTLIAEVVGAKSPRCRAPRSLSLAVARLATGVSWLSGKEPGLTPEMVRAASVCGFYTSAKAERELGYAPLPFRQALEETAEYLRAQGRI